MFLWRILGFKMKNYIGNITTLGIILFLTCCTDSGNIVPEEEEVIDILTQLESIEGATVSELPSADHFNRIFEIKFSQPVDHQNPTGPKFLQKVFIGHVDTSEPVILETEGYSRTQFKTRKLASLSRSNQVSVEHRYFGESIPSSFSWDKPHESNYLTVKQAADDIHNIVMALQEIYKSSWVSSGRSKGGSTSVYHRRYYPDDVVGTVPIVAPLLFAREDPRYIDGFFNEVGTSECRQKIMDFQRAILEKLDKLPPLLDDNIEYINAHYETNFHFTYPQEMLLKHMVIEYSYSFWRSTSLGCDDIPDSESSADDLFQHLIGIVDVVDYSNWGVEFWRPYYYQSITETGETGYPTEHIDDLLDPLEPFFEFEKTATFNAQTMMDIDQWVKTNAEDIVFIYGENDPWTVGAFEFGMNESLIKLIAPEAKHEATFELLTDEDQQLLSDRFFKWTGKILQ